MKRYLLSPAAEADLDEIWDYTADQWSIEQADLYVAQVRQACASIGADHRSGSSIAHVRGGYRKLSVGFHFIIFKLVDDSILIVRVLHQRMDIPSRLRN